MNNKERAISFLRLASSGNVWEAYGTYVHPQFRHHNPYFPGDRAALLAGWRKVHSHSPGRNLRRCALWKTEIW